MKTAHTRTYDHPKAAGYVKRDSLYVTYFPQKYLVGMNATKFRFIRTGDFMLKGII